MLAQLRQARWVGHPTAVCYSCLSAMQISRLLLLEQPNRIVVAVASQERCLALLVRLRKAVRPNPGNAANCLGNESRSQRSSLRQRGSVARSRSS
jgi:hypothetical protein